MKSIMTKIILLGAFSFIGLSAQAEGITESALLLRQAMMQSNADYNVLKKKTNHEEFDRADDWGERETHAINIQKTSLAVSDQEEFKQLKEDFMVDDRALSSTLEADDEYTN